MTVSTDQYYMVAENTTDCQPSDGECHPLSFYVANSSSYFTDNTIFYFKKGTHDHMLMDEIDGIQNVIKPACYYLYLFKYSTVLTSVYPMLQYVT